MSHYAGMSLHDDLFPRKHKRKPLEEVVRGVYRWSVDHLRELEARMQDNYTPEKLNPLMWVLEEGTKIGLKEARLEQLDAGSMAFILICHFGRWRFPSAAEKETVERRLISSLDSILYWAEYITWHSPDGSTGTETSTQHSGSMKPGQKVDYYVGTVCIGLFELSTQSKPIATAAAVSDRFLKLSLFFWLATVGGKPLIYPSITRHWDPRSGDPTTVLFGLMVSLAPSIDKIVELIHEGSLCLPEEFVRRTIDRMKAFEKPKYIPHLTHFPEETVENKNLKFVAYTARTLMSADRELCYLFSTAQAPELFMRVLVAVNTRVMRAAQSQDQAQKANIVDLMGSNLDAAVCVMQMINLTCDFRPVLHTCKVLQAGVLQLVGNFLSTSPPSHVLKGNHHDIDSALVIIMGVLTDHSLFPKVLRPLCHEMDRHISGLPSRILVPSPEEKEGLGASFKNWKAFSRYLDNTHRVSVCDNLKHPPSKSRGGDAKGVPKACSNCRSVVYCSSQCQIEDWNVRHRQECYNMRIDYLERQGSLSYPYSTRVFYLSSIRHIYEAAMSTPLAAPAVMSRSRIKGVTMMEPIQDIRKMRAFTPEAYTKKLTPFIPAFKLKRFNDIVDHYRQQTNRLVQPGSSAPDAELDLVHSIGYINRLEIHWVVLLRRVRASKTPFGTLYVNIQREAVTSDFEVAQALWFINTPRRSWL
ncbi:hypothetical protein DFP72DRAFT_916089 [Ephemerocybe angulata]|uniref:MYND-type domain-containing protein n=1 Tax=Ephemerocybe angulata TaxID=980116 RepID=A0A8H6HMM3_9AGAR|nr:hypothetical protein DFP72DRAFT_916089 [Tulosesus angulatus]